MAKKINIFIGTSEDDLKSDLIELRNCVHKLGEIYEGMDIVIRPLPDKWQGFSEEDIEDSEMCFFVFGLSSDSDNEKNLADAYNLFVKSGKDKPKVYVFFSIPQREYSPDESIGKLQKKIDEEYHHFYGSYNNVDSIKLRITESLQVLGFDSIPVEIRQDGGVYVNGRKIADIKNISEFANHKVLKEKESELEKVEEKYFELLPEYEKKEDNKEYSKEFNRLYEKRRTLLKEIEELRKKILELSMGLSRDVAKGEMSPRLKAAYKRLEVGDAEGCLRILDLDEAIYEAEAEERAIKEAAKEALRKVYAPKIREQRVAINVLLTQYDDADRFSKIERNFEWIIPKAKEYEIELVVILDYADYVQDYKTGQDAESVIEELKWLLANETDPYLKASCFNKIGDLYFYCQSDLEEAEKNFKQAYDLFAKLIEESADYLDVFASICNDLGIIYGQTNRLSESLNLQLKSFKLLEKLVEEEPEYYSEEFSATCSSLASLYQQMDKGVEGEEIIEQSFKSLEKLESKDPKEYGPSFSAICIARAQIMVLQGRNKDAIQLSERGITILKKILKEDPESIAYRVMVALGEVLLASLYGFENRESDIKPLLDDAIDCLELVVSRQPNSFAKSLLAFCYSSLATCSLESEAKQLYYKSAEIAEEITNPSLNDKVALATCYFNIGVFCEENDLEKQVMLKKAIGVLEAVENEDPSNAVVRYTLGVCYGTLGLVVDESLTESYLLKAIDYLKGIKTLSAGGWKALPDYYGELAELYERKEQYAEAADTYKNEIEIREKLVDDNPEGQLLRLAGCYNSLAELHVSAGRLQEASELYVKSINLFMARQTEENSGWFDGRGGFCYIYSLLDSRIPEQYQSNGNKKQYFRIIEELLEFNDWDCKEPLDELIRSVEGLSQLVGYPEQLMNLYKEAVRKVSSLSYEEIEEIKQILAKRNNG